MQLALRVLRIRRSPRGGGGDRARFLGVGLGFFALVLAATQGCSHLPDWVSSPPADRMVALGFSPCPNFASQGVARIMAESDARDKIRQAIAARMRSLVQSWASAVRDRSERKTLVSILTGEAFLGEFVERAAGGAKPLEVYYDREEESFYALLVLEDPERALAEFTEACRKKAFETFAWNEAQKEALAERMENTRRRYAEEELETLEELSARRGT